MSENKDKASTDGQSRCDAKRRDCPHCGRCPTCGRGGYYPYLPWYPYPYTDFWEDGTIYVWSSTDSDSTCELDYQKDISLKTLEVSNDGNHLRKKK